MYLYTHPLFFEHPAKEQHFPDHQCLWIIESLINWVRPRVMQLLFFVHVGWQMFFQALMNWEIWKGHQRVVLSEHQFFVKKAYQGVTGLCCWATAQMLATQTTACIHSLPCTDSTAAWSGVFQLLATGNSNSVISRNFTPKHRFVFP